MTKIILVLICCGTVFAESVALTQNYVDSRTGLLIHFPAGWTVDHDAGAFRITNFDLSRSLPQLIVPMGGAQLVLTGAPTGVKTAQDWLSSDRITPTNGYDLSEVEIHIPGYQRAPAVLARSHPRGIPDSTIVLCLFSIDGQLLKASMLCRTRGKSHALEDILIAVIQNLEKPKR